MGWRVGGEFNMAKHKFEILYALCKVYSDYISNLMLFMLSATWVIECAGPMTDSHNYRYQMWCHLLIKKNFIIAISLAGN